MLYVFVNRRGDLVLPRGKLAYPAFTNKADAEEWLQWVKRWLPSEEDGVLGWLSTVENTNVRIQVLTKELILRALESMNGVKVRRIETFEEEMTDEEYEQLLDDGYPETLMALDPDLSFHKDWEDWLDDCEEFLGGPPHITGDVIRLLGYDHRDYGRALAKVVEATNATFQRDMDERIMAGTLDIRTYDPNWDPDPEGILDWDPDKDDFPGAR